MMGGWLARLKNEKVPDTHATKPTETLFVGFVAYPPAPFQKFEGEQTPANDGQAHGIGLLSSPTLEEKTLSNNGQNYALDWLATVDGTDLHTWPHTQAMNPSEVDTFTARLARFTDKGVSYDDAERLADKLVIRDREGDDRRLCLECIHLQGVGRWKCGNWRAADVVRVGLAPDLVLMLQRCGGYRGGASANY